MSIATPLLSTNHSVYALYYHLVLATKYRRKVLSGPMQIRLKTIAAETALRAARIPAPSGLAAEPRPSLRLWTRPVAAQLPVNLEVPDGR